MKKELVSKDELIKITMEKSNKVNEEKEKIRCINRGLEKTIENLKGQCKDYQTIISFNEEKINQLKEKLNKNELIKESTLNLDSIIKEEEEENNNNNNYNKNDNKNDNENKNDNDNNNINKNININNLK